MSFLLRSNSSRRWSGGNGPPNRMPRDDSLGALNEASRDYGASSNNSSSYLREEIRAARAGVAGLDRYVAKAESFKEISLQMSEEACRALSRLEQAAAIREAPELIVVACEIKVAARRGLLLIKMYGRYRFLGKLVAVAMRASVHEKYDRVIMQLTSLLPSAGAPGAAGSAELDSMSVLNARSTGGLAHAGSMVSAMSGVSMLSAPSPTQLSPHQQQQQQQQHVLSPGHSQSHMHVPGAQTQPPTPGPAYAGQLIRPGKHDRVYSISYVPGAQQGWPASTCFWWAVGDGIEFYSDSTQCTTSFPIEKERNNMMCIAIDGRGNVWGGTVKGYVRVRKKKSWDMVVEDRVLSCGVRMIAFDGDEDGVAWVGDEAGHVRIVRYDEAAQKLEVIGSLFAGDGGAPVRDLAEGVGLRRQTTQAATPSGNGVGIGRSGNGGAESGVFPPRRRNGTRRRGPFPCGGSEPSHLEGPVRAALVRDGRAWVAGGRSEPWLALYDSGTYTQLDCVRCHSVGSCHAMSMLSWEGRRPSPGSPAPVLQHFRRTCSSSDLGGNGGQRSVEVLVEEDDPRATWQLLTGHECGLVLVWQATSDVLQPVMKIGDTTSAVRGIAVFETLDLVCTAHANGELSMFVRPSEDMEWGAAPRTTPSQAVSVLRPRRITLRAHRSAITFAIGMGETLVTASALGTIRIWHAAELAREAERQGLVLGGALRSPAETLEHRRSSFNSQSKSLNSFSRARTTSSIPSDLGKVSYSSSTQQMQSQPQLLHHGRSHSGSMVDGHMLLLSSNPLIPLNPNSSYSGASAPHNIISSAAAANSNAANGRNTAAGANGAHANGVSGSFAVIHSGSNALFSDRGGAYNAPSGYNAPGDKPFASGSYAQGGGAVGSMPYASSMANSSSMAHSGSFPMTYASTGGLASNMGVGGGGAGGLNERYGGGVSSSAPMNVLADGPRAPLALREQMPVGTTRERRKSQRRLSRGSQMNFGNCQMIESTELKLLNLIGSGAYGKVWLADWAGTQVAAKELVSFQAQARDKVVKKHKRRHNSPNGNGSEGGNSSGSDESGSESSDSADSVDEEVTAELKELMNEVYLLGTMSHPNIMRFCAVVLDPPMIVTQYYAHGSLFDLLKRARRGEKRAVHELSWTKRLDMLRDIAAGMVFLHSRRPAPVIHGDLRSPNLLLDLAYDKDRPRFHVKIADFGLARMLGPGQSLAVSKVTNPRWSAPEVISRSEVSKSADVFSFGVVMWEMLTWQQPYEEMMSVQVLFSVMQNYRPEVLPDAELPGRPGASLPLFKELMERCWAAAIADRPPFEIVVAKLDEMRAMDVAMRKSESSKSLARNSRRLSDSETAPVTPRSAPTSGQSTYSEAEAAALYAASVLGVNVPGGVAGILALHGVGNGVGSGIGNNGSGGDSATSITDPAAMFAAAAAAAGVTSGVTTVTGDVVRAYSRSDPGAGGDDAGRGSSYGLPAPPPRLQLARLGSQPEGSGYSHGYTSASSQASSMSGASTQQYGAPLGARSTSGPNRHVLFNLNPAPSAATSIGAASSVTGGASTPNSPGSPIGHGELSFAFGTQPWAQQPHEAADAAEPLSQQQHQQQAQQQTQQQQVYGQHPALVPGISATGVPLPAGVERSVGGRISGGGFAMSRLGPGGTRSSGSLHAGRSDASDALPSPRFSGAGYGSPSSPSMVHLGAAVNTGSRYAAGASTAAAVAPAGGPFAAASHAQGSSPFGSSTGGYGGSSTGAQPRVSSSDSASSSPFAASSEQQQHQQALPLPAMQQMQQQGQEQQQQQQQQGQLHHRRSGSAGSSAYGSQTLPPLHPHVAAQHTQHAQQIVHAHQVAAAASPRGAYAGMQRAGSDAAAYTVQLQAPVAGMSVAATQQQGQQQQGQQQQVLPASPFAAAQQTSAAAGGPFAAIQRQASGSPFGAAQQAPAANSPFAAAQQTPAPAGNSPFVAAQQAPVGNSPFAAAQQASAPAANSPFAAAQASAQANSPFAAAQQAPAAVPQRQQSSSSPFAAAQPAVTANSPFAAAQPTVAANSPFAAAQPAGTANSPFAAAQPTVAANSPFAAAQPSGNSPFAAAPPHAAPFSPFAAAQQPVVAAHSPFAAAQHPRGTSPPAAAPNAASIASAAAAPYSPFAAAQQMPASRAASNDGQSIPADQQQQGQQQQQQRQGQQATRSRSASPQPQPYNSPFAAVQAASLSPSLAASLGPPGTQIPKPPSPFAAVASTDMERLLSHGSSTAASGSFPGSGPGTGPQASPRPVSPFSRYASAAESFASGERTPGQASSRGASAPGSARVSDSGCALPEQHQQQHQHGQQQQQQQQVQHQQWWLGTAGGNGVAAAQQQQQQQQQAHTVPRTADSSGRSSAAASAGTSPRSRLAVLQASFPDSAVAPGAAVTAGVAGTGGGAKLYKPLSSFVISAEDPSLSVLRQGLPPTDSLTFPVSSDMGWQ